MAGPGGTDVGVPGAVVDEAGNAELGAGDGERGAVDGGAILGEDAGTAGFCRQFTRVSKTVNKRRRTKMAPNQAVRLPRRCTTNSVSSGLVTCTSERALARLCKAGDAAWAPIPVERGRGT